uniref:Guanylate cyclase activator 2B n=1 Tax=Sinocyclocheilus anshuiensis TaxID=1608454 RepID=A0A671MFJ6_9TELE
MVANALHSQYLPLKETLAICKVIILGGLYPNIFQFNCVVKKNGYSFSLEAVKTLRKLMETDTSTNPRQTYGDAAALCADPDLPGEFRVLCGKDDAGEVFQRLGWYPLKFFTLCYIAAIC